MQRDYLAQISPYQVYSAGLAVEVARRIGLGGIAIFYDVGQGQGWQRNIVMNGSPHLPADIRQWYDDSRGLWEGDTLVVDVTNFSPKKIPCYFPCSEGNWYFSRDLPIFGKKSPKFRELKSIHPRRKR